MRIRYLSQYYPPEPGAPSARVSGLARAWVSRGHDVEVVTGMPNHPTGEVTERWRGVVAGREEQDGVSVQRNWLLAVPNGNRMALRMAAQASYAGSAAALGIPRSRGADVVIATSPSVFTGWAGLAHARAARIPWVFEVRDLWPQLFIEMGLIKDPPAIAAARAMERTLYRKADRIVTVTGRFRDRIAESGVSADKIDVIPNGVDLAMFRPQQGEREAIRDAWGLRDKYVISYVGTHGLLHRLDFLLDVAERLRDDPAIAVLFVGDGADRERLQSIAAEKRLANVRFAGLQPYEAVRGFYVASDLCYVPLRPDPFLVENFVPSKIFEILATGTPVLGALGGEAAEILMGSGNARVVPPGDVDAIGDAVRAFRAEGRDETKAAGARRYAERWSRDVLAERYLAVFERML